MPEVSAAPEKPKKSPCFEANFHVCREVGGVAGPKRTRLHGEEDEEEKGEKQRMQQIIAEEQQKPLSSTAPVLSRLTTMREGTLAARLQSGVCTPTIWSPAPCQNS